MRPRRGCLWRGALRLAGVLVLLCALAALSNLGLARGTAAPERLDELELARLAEAEQLRRALGDDVWPGWGGADALFSRGD